LQRCAVIGCVDAPSASRYTLAVSARVGRRKRIGPCRAKSRWR
jgi:hypothetical protein